MLSCMLPICLGLPGRLRRASTGKTSCQAGYPHRSHLLPLLYYCCFGCSCFTGGFTPFTEDPGACTLYSLGGFPPSVDQQGPETSWVSGVPTGKTLPTLPAYKEGGCCRSATVCLTAEHWDGVHTGKACLDVCSQLLGLGWDPPLAGGC